MGVKLHQTPTHNQSPQGRFSNLPYTTKPKEHQQ